MKLKKMKHAKPNRNLIKQFRVSLCITNGLYRFDQTFVYFIFDIIILMLKIRCWNVTLYGRFFAKTE